MWHTANSNDMCYILWLQKEYKMLPPNNVRSVLKIGLDVKHMCNSISCGFPTADDMLLHTIMNRVIQTNLPHPSHARPQKNQFNPVYILNNKSVKA
jgi:hypothetical protein